MAHPFPLFAPIWSPSREVLVTPEITSALEVGAVVAIGVSGGKDLGPEFVIVPDVFLPPRHFRSRLTTRQE